jgi:flavine halogenase
MLASMRFFLRFIDLEETFDQYGFMKKVRPCFRGGTERGERALIRPTIYRH